MRSFDANIAEVMLVNKIYIGWKELQRPIPGMERVSMKNKEDKKKLRSALFYPTRRRCGVPRLEC